VTGLKIIGFVGLPGSGKGEASQIARRLGLAVVVMGDVIRREAARQGLEPCDENLGRIGSELRAREGPTAVARRTLEMARATGKDIIVVDGLRSREEAEFFRANAEDFYLVEICAPAGARMKRLAARGRPDDPGRPKDADEDTVSSCHDLGAALGKREDRELSWGMGEAMRAADLKLHNDGSLDELHRNVEQLFRILAADLKSPNELRPR
jgi:cytidylate kinase